MKEFIKKFWNDNKDQLLKALKASARYLIFLIIGYAISYYGSLPQTGSISLIFTLLTFVDKWLHENWKLDKSGPRGISPF